MAFASLTHTCGVVVEDDCVIIKKSTNKYTTFFSQMFEPFLLGYWVSDHLQYCCTWFCCTYTLVVDMCTSANYIVYTQFCSH